MDIRNMFRLIEDSGVRQIVATKELRRLLADREEIHWFDDARSAGFFAMGLWQTSREPVAFLVPDAFLPSAYTAVVEAWFQKAALFVVSVADGNWENSYLDTYLLEAYRDRRGQDAPEVVRESGPVLIEARMDAASETTCARPLDLAVLRSEFDADVEWLVAEELAGPGGAGGLAAIPERHKYCSLTKYVGWLNGGDARAVLVVPLEWLRLDLNVLNCRHLTDRFKVVLRADPGWAEPGIEGWIAENGIRLHRGSLESAATLKEFAGDPAPSILVFET